jgi:SAM-dependent methyltransferase
MDRWSPDRLHFAQARCTGCGLLVSQPQATDDEAHEYYQYSYYQQLWPDAESIWIDNTRHNRDFEWPLFQSLWKEWPPPRGGEAVEIGCGYGVMLGLMRDEGFKVRGCELSAAAVAICRQHGLDVVVGKAPGVPWPKGQCDLACALHVIEHVSDPIGFVRELVELVRPGGVIAIATEDGWTSQYQWVRLKARLFGRLPPLHTSTDHTFVFQARHLTTLLHQAGCDAVRTRSFSVVPKNESIHWKLFKGCFRQLDRLLGHGDYLLAVGRRRGEGT